MGPYEYLLIRIDGDYAWLQRVDQDNQDILPIARALLPPEVEEEAVCVMKIFAIRLYKRKRRKENENMCSGTYRGMPGSIAAES